MERKIHIWENWLIFLEIQGEAELILRILGAKEKYFQGFWEIDTLFSGIKGAHTPWRPQKCKSKSRTKEKVAFFNAPKLS